MDRSRGASPPGGQVQGWSFYLLHSPHLKTIPDPGFNLRNRVLRNLGKKILDPGGGLIGVTTSFDNKNLKSRTLVLMVLFLLK